MNSIQFSIIIAYLSQYVICILLATRRARVLRLLNKAPAMYWSLDRGLYFRKDT